MNHRIVMRVMLMAFAFCAGLPASAVEKETITVIGTRINDASQLSSQPPTAATLRTPDATAPGDEVWDVEVTKLEDVCTDSGLENYRDVGEFSTDAEKLAVAQAVQASMSGWEVALDDILDRPVGIRLAQGGILFFIPRWNSTPTLLSYSGTGAGGYRCH